MLIKESTLNINDIEIDKPIETILIGNSCVSIYTLLGKGIYLDTPKLEDRDNGLDYKNLDINNIIKTDIDYLLPTKEVVEGKLLCLLGEYAQEIKQYKLDDLHSKIEKLGYTYKYNNKSKNVMLGNEELFIVNNNSNLKICYDINSNNKYTKELNIVCPFKSLTELDFNGIKNLYYILYSTHLKKYGNEFMKLTKFEELITRCLDEQSNKVIDFIKR